MARLPDNFICRILAGHPGPLGWAIAGDCSVAAGDVEILRQHPIVSVTILGVRRTRKGGATADYRVRDDRPRLLRRTPPAHQAKRKRDEPTASALRSAAEESGYTQSMSQAVQDAGEAVPPEYQRRLSVEASAGIAWRQEQRRLRAAQVRYERKLQNARRRGTKAAVHLEHQVNRISGLLENAA